MNGISTHILDTSIGKPAAGIPVHLFWKDRELASATTNGDGRVPALLPHGIPLSIGTYRIVFTVGSRWPEAFYPEVSITFTVNDVQAHYHIPLLISPFGFTTYRGS